MRKNAARCAMSSPKTLRRLVPVRRAAGGVQERDVVGVGELLRRRARRARRGGPRARRCAARARAAARCRGRSRARGRRPPRQRGSVLGPARSRSDPDSGFRLTVGRAPILRDACARTARPSLPRRPRSRSASSSPSGRRRRRRRPGTLVSSRFSAPARRAGEDEPVVVAPDGVAEPLGARERAEEEEEERERQPLAVLSVTASSGRPRRAASRSRSGRGPRHRRVPARARGSPTSSRAGRRGGGAASPARRRARARRRPGPPSCRRRPRRRARRRTACASGGPGRVEHAQALVTPTSRSTGQAPVLRRRSRAARRVRRSRGRPPAARRGGRCPARARRPRYGVAVRASNLRAWVTARLVSSTPVIPAGKPR